jgi:hypothetical protein
VPEIHADGDNITFLLVVAGAPDDTRLQLRCGANGEVWAAIVSINAGSNTRQA